MTTQKPPITPPGMRLYNTRSRRLYLDADERRRFIEITSQEPLHIRAFCFTLLYSGCRLSEAREMSLFSIGKDADYLVIRSLKKRNEHHIREIPVPAALIHLLRQQWESHDSPHLFPGGTSKQVDRVAAYRWVKRIMHKSDIHGPQACPKGLRHGYGIHAIRCGVQLNMLQKWMGHTSIRTTAIYVNAVGAEEIEIAEKMWD